MVVRTKIAEMSANASSYREHGESVQQSSFQLSMPSRAGCRMSSAKLAPHLLPVIEKDGWQEKDHGEQHQDPGKHSVTSSRDCRSAQCRQICKHDKAAEKIDSHLPLPLMSQPTVFAALGLMNKMPASASREELLGQTFRQLVHAAAKLQNFMRAPCPKV